jgi:hypothetical protein
MKTTVDLPEDVVREVKLRAVLQRRTVKALVTDLLRSGLGMETTPDRFTSSRIVIDENGFPTIRSRPGAPAEKMTTEDWLRLERESEEAEDLHRAGIIV